MSRDTSSPARQLYSIADYVRLESYSNVRHEFYEGQIYAMAGGPPEHGTYAANVIALLAAQLAGRPCRVQTSDVRIRVQATGLSTYPDVGVVCGHAETDPADADAIVNPVVLVEILSPTTEAYDRGEKLQQYQRIGSLREVVLVGHDARYVEVVRRGDDDRWSSTRVDSGVTRLESIDCELDVDAVYRDPLAG